MNKYTILEAQTAEALSAEVTKRLNMPGWFLVGGVAVVNINKDDPVNGNYLYSQAMVFDEGQLKRHAQQIARPK